MAVNIYRDAEPIPGYRLIERIGGGGFGEVWKAEAPGGLLKAIKFVHGDMESAEEEGAQAEQELKALKRVQNVRHSYMLSLERYDIVDGQLIIVMELADRTLWDRFKECRSNGLPGIPRSELIGYMREAAEALDFMYSQFQLLHLDIKPQNIFLVHNHSKVADFGLIKGLEGTAASITGGVTPVYAAPETFDGHCTSSTDQYSLAIVYQELLTGQRPFAGTTARQLVLQHLQAEPDLSALPATDQPVVRKALEKSHKDRFRTCGEFVEALEAASPAKPRQRVSDQQPDPNLPAPSGPTNGFSTKSDGDDSVVVNGHPTGNSAATGHSMRLPGGVVSELSMDESSGFVDRVTTHSRERPAPFSPPLSEKPSIPAAGGTRVVNRMSGAANTAQGPVHGRTLIETSEDGILRPVLLIGTGSMGRAAITRFRNHLCDHFGSVDRLPNIRTLLLDTDPEALKRAMSGGGSALRPGETLLTKLQRPSHYIKPKDDNSLIEDWIPQKLIYRIPRHLTADGVRAFGRLAFVDNYNTIYHRIRSELEACVDSEILRKAQENTGEGVISTVPRVFLVTSLAGGTGSGMFIDLAYLIRSLMLDLGHVDPDIVGVLLLPERSKSEAKNADSANVVAALTELQYFSRTDTTYVDRCGLKYSPRTSAFRCSDPPFGRCVFVPTKGSQYSWWDEAAEGAMPPPSATSAAGVLFVELCTELGRDANKQRDKWLNQQSFSKTSRGGPVVYQSSELVRIHWPNKLIIHHSANQLCRRLVQHWMSKDAKRLSKSVSQWVQENWANMDLGAERLIRRYQDACDVRLGFDPEDVFKKSFAAIEQAVGGTGKRKGRVLPLGKLVGAIEEFEALLGIPEECQAGNSSAAAEGEKAGKVNASLRAELSALANECEVKIAELVVRLIEQPAFRLAGAEETLRQFITIVDKALENQEALSRDVKNRTAAMYIRMLTLLDAPKDVKEKSSTWRLAFTRKTNAKTLQQSQELLELIRDYPKSRYHSIVLQHVSAFYVALRGQLSDQLREVDFCRDRLSELSAKLKEADDHKRNRSTIREQSDRSLRILLPEGCRTIDRAVDAFLQKISPEEFQRLDHLVEKIIRKHFRALVNICMASSNLLRNVIPAMLSVAEGFLQEHADPTDVVQLYLASFEKTPSEEGGPEEALADALQSDYKNTQPIVLDSCTEDSICRFACPPSPKREDLCDAVEDSFPVSNVEFSKSDDEIIIYREVLSPSFAELRQLDDKSRNIYQKLRSHDHLTPHNRLDITAWVPATS